MVAAPGKEFGSYSAPGWQPWSSHDDWSSSLTVARPGPNRIGDDVRVTVQGAPAGPQLRVAVSGARGARGSVTVTLYGPRREDFLARGGRLARQRIPLAGATAVEACFALAAPGDYAVAVYHDENDDRDFNRNAVGLPVEGYGFSNDAPTAFGLPDFDRVRFTLPPGGRRIAVRLRY